MYLFIGLGNPEAGQQGHRHNAGFMAIDRIASAYRFPDFKKKFQGKIAQGLVSGHKILLLKPETYMNNSGQSAQAAARFYSISPERVFVFYDELDLPLGKIKLKQGGGSGGHNGIKSLDAHLDNPDYWRVRIGIGHPGHKDKVTKYVLSNFAKSEESLLDKTLTAISDHADLLLSKNNADFMTRIAEAIKT